MSNLLVRTLLAHVGEPVGLYYENDTPIGILREVDEGFVAIESPHGDLSVRPLQGLVKVEVGGVIPATFEHKLFLQREYGARSLRAGFEREEKCLREMIERMDSGEEPENPLAAMLAAMQGRNGR